MALLTWDNKYSVGINEIDIQHKKLFTLVNDLNEAMRVGKGKDVLSKILSGLIDYTKTHFATEERLMKIHSYNDSVKHKVEHDKLTRQVLDFQKSFNEGKLAMSLEIMNFLKKWLEEHIFKSDKVFGKFLGEKGVK